MLIQLTQGRREGRAAPTGFPLHSTIEICKLCLAARRQYVPLQPEDTITALYFVSVTFWAPWCCARSLRTVLRRSLYSRIVHTVGTVINMSTVKEGTLARSRVRVCGPPQKHSAPSFPKQRSTALKAYQHVCGQALTSNLPASRCSLVRDARLDQP